ncbi:MAG: hypothetical protein E6L04_05530 [Thaumarchaeota archaeon]|nr:MAG: hypothetical protein E6L04_05530 [Nitrososphaerota archaeon]TLX93018.1 MAG: hypothetical protein E6K97_00040 [Nitrososphaerota archaeon]
MQFCKPKQDIKLPLLVTLITITILSFSMDEDRYAYSQSLKPNSTANATGSGVDLINTHPSPVNVKTGSKFEILSTVVNNSPNKILLPAGLCDSPLTAFFMSNNVVIKHSQGCTATSPPFELNPGQEVTVAGPASGTIYQAIKVGKTPATATVYYLTENRQPGNVTKPFVFTIN